jgi:hypothetical protein
MTAQFLTDREFAELFLSDSYVDPDADAFTLEPEVERYLRKHDMLHRSAFAIAAEAAKIIRSVAPPASRPLSTDVAAAAADVSEGFGDQRLPSADEVAAMDMREFGKLRQQLGIGAPGQGVLGPIGG